MAKLCTKCGKKLSLFAKDDICSECSKGIKNEIKEMKVQVIQTGYLQDRHLELLKMVDKSHALKLYDQLYEKFYSDKGLDEREIETLGKLQSAANLSESEVKYNERVLPSFYASFIKDKGRVPTAEIALPEGGTLILKKDEVTYFANATVLKELRSVTVGYEGRSAGGSVRIMKGAWLRLGAYKGHVLREDRLVDTSRGLLVLTDKRLLLSPAAGCKAIDIPLEKIFSINGYENGLEIGVEGRTKSCFFSMNIGAVEIFSMCINHLLGK